jgi:hypothetical protein
MRKINLDKTVYYGRTSLDTHLEMWSKNFNYETSKFISAARIKPEDLGRIFLDKDNVEWKILGMIDGKEVPCEKVSTGEIFCWEKMKISHLLYPDLHQKKQKVEYIFPEKPKRKKKSEEPESKPSDTQLDLFSGVE